MLIAQITDLHAGYQVEVDGKNIDTLEGVRRAVVHINAMTPRPDAVVATGDLVAEERLETYQDLATAVAPLAMPLYVIPGNHDDRGLIRQVFGGAGYLPEGEGFLHYAVEDQELRLVALDTQDTGLVSGLLCAARLDWLSRTLAAAPDRPTLIVMHHPPFRTGIPGFDTIGLSGRDALGEIVARNPQVRAIACGHVHRDIVTSWRGTLVAVTPSTGYQYPLELNNDAELVMAAEPPALRLLLWNPDDGLVSHLSYVPA